MRTAIIAAKDTKKLNVQHGQLVQQLYSPEMQGALEARAEALEEESRDLRRSVREAEERLEEYRRVRGIEGLVKECGADLFLEILNCFVSLYKCTCVFMISLDVSPWHFH